MKSNEKMMDIANGPLLKNIIIFSIPLIFSNLLQMFFNSADTIIVGKFAGDTALAAVGATGSIVFLITSLFNGLATGANVIIARYIGTGDQNKIKDSVHTSIALAFVGGIVLTIVGILFSFKFLQLMNTPEEFIRLSTLYMQIYFVGSIFLLLYNFGAAVLRSKGDTKRPLYFLLISGVINIILNLIIVKLLNLSIVGVAISTVISEAVSAFLVISVLINETDATKLNIKKLYIDFESLRQIVKIGIPAGLQGAVFALSNVVIQSSINSFDSTDIVAGNTAGANIENYVYIGYMAFNQATITFTSQCVGAKRYDRIKEIMLKTLGLVIVGAIIMSSIVYFAGPIVLKLYTNEQTVIDVGMIRTKHVARFLVLNGILDTFVNSLRGMGHSSLPTILMIVGICGVRLLWIDIIFPIYKTLESIYLCFPISWIVTSIIEIILWLIVYNKTIKNIVN